MANESHCRNSPRFTGRENDGTGLYYYRARYYNPTLQRFISEDPARLGGGEANFYVYAGNSPADYDRYARPEKQKRGDIVCYDDNRERCYMSDPIVNPDSARPRGRFKKRLHNRG